MWLIVSKKQHHKVLDEWGQMERSLRDDLGSLSDIIAIQQGNIAAKDIAAKDILPKSTEREKVLADLLNALNMILGYQRALRIVSAFDPQILQANSLLAKYGMQGDPNASYLGFQRLPPETFEERIAREEKEWGDEAYGSGNVRIEAEVIDEGEDKEEGYSRARLSFYDADDSSDVRESAFTSDTLGI